MLTSKVGMAKKSNDPEMDEYNRNFTEMEKAIEALLKDSKIFNDSVVKLLESGAKFAEIFGGIFHPLAGEYDLLGKHPEAEKTTRNVDGYSTAMQELRDTLNPELELIATRIIGPAKEFQTSMKTIRKNITKRDHKLVDYDRHNNNLNKLREKKEKTLNDERNLFKLEQDFDVATQEYEAINGALKHELPQFMVLATRFIDPLFHSFYYMQLNIYYLTMEKLQGFATEAKYNYSVSPYEIQSEYQERRGDVYEQVESLSITKRTISTTMRMAQPQNSSTSGLSRSTTSASTASGFKKAPPPPPPGSGAPLKKMPPPPPGSSSAAVKRANTTATAMAAPPPPYSQSAASPQAGIVAATKRPPPPPPGKPKPPVPQPVYVVALYDFVAQADGDLEFKAGDHIEVLNRTPSTEDWWKGRLNGREGVFPGNYVQDA